MEITITTPHNSLLNILFILKDERMCKNKKHNFLNSKSPVERKYISCIYI